jgi:hypothetical protein
VRCLYGDWVLWQKLNKKKEAYMMQTKQTKTWKIGEECVGGIIQAKISQSSYFPSCTTVKILIKDYKTQEIVDSQIFGRLHESRLEVYLNDMTSSYHASKVVEWVKKNAWYDNATMAFVGKS